ncbi:unnamed protein product [Rotaria magnacalcarata]|uniref:Uncharacterized protein n=1 Tax=Rotaria magnacalcarata TaxID=392030 RepID=A0A816X942_9BILA|nr:unnamed protein product [Rotaria magnacalcarata]CAF4151453.1 unnamed protein product [Rotaria magnacalcarata]
MTPVNDYSNDTIRPSTSCVASAIRFLKEKFISFEQVKISDDLPTTSIPCTTEENLSIRPTISLKENFPGSIVNLMDSPMEHVAGNIKPYVANNSRVTVTQDKIVLPEWSNSLGARPQADYVNSLMKLVPAVERVKESLDKNLIDMRELVENYKSTEDCTSIDTDQQEEIIALFMDTNSMDSTQVDENSNPAVGYTNSIVKGLLPQSTKSSEDHNSLDAVNLKETVKLCTDNNSMYYYYVKPIGDNHSIDSGQFSNNDESPEKYNSLNTVELVETFKLTLDNNSIDLVQVEEIAKSTVDSNSMDEGQLAENEKSIGDCTSIDTDQQEEIITLFMVKNSMDLTQVGENSKPAVSYTNSIVKGLLAQSTKSSEDHNSLDAVNLKKAVKLCTDNNSMDYSYVKPTGDIHSMDSGQLSNNDESPEKYNSLNTVELVETVQPLFDNNSIDLAQVEEIAKSTVDITSMDEGQLAENEKSIGDNNLVDTGQLEEYDSLVLKNMSKNSEQGEKNYKSTSSNSMGIGLLTENDKLSGDYISTYTVQCEENVQLFMNNDSLESIQAEENDKLTAVPYSMDTLQLKENFRMGLSLENNLQDNGRHLDTVKLSECNIAVDTENQIENATFFMDKNSLGTLKVEENFELNVMASSVSAVEVAPENKYEIFLEENLAFLNKHPINEPDCRYRVQEFEANNAATISEPLHSTILPQNNESVMENMYKSTESIAKFDASKLSSRYDNFGFIIAPQHPLMHNASAINNNMPAISDLANSCTDAITSCQTSTAAIGSVELNTEVFESTDKLFCNNSIEDCHKSSSILLQDSTMTTDGMKICEVNSTENKLGDNLLNSPDSLQDIPTVKPTMTNLLEIAVQSFLKTKLIDQSLESQLPKTTWAHDLVGNIEIPEICYYSVMEKCKYEEKCCSRLHCIRHFHWQIKGTDDKWYNLLNEQVFQLEAAYCDVNVEETTLFWEDSFGQSTSLRWKYPILLVRRCQSVDCVRKQSMEKKLWKTYTCGIFWTLGTSGSNTEKGAIQRLEV